MEIEKTLEELARRIFYPHFLRKILPLSKRGSDRDFFRLTLDDGSTVIAIHFNPARLENSYYAKIGRFLEEIGVPVPKIISEIEEKDLIFVEDLGDTDLFSKRNEPWSLRKRLYEDSLRAILPLHTFDPEYLRSKKIRISEAFSPKLYEWERDYFFENFVRGLLRLNPDQKFLRRLKREFEEMTLFLLDSKQSLIHRDFQSQNLMVKDGKIYIIDFQGLRVGNPLYDLGSLVFDPYSPLLDGERDEIIKFYYSQNDLGLPFEEFALRLKVASIQRLIQALGAYSFLFLKKGLKNYLQFVPSALWNLNSLLSRIFGMDNLRELIKLCDKKYSEIIGSKEGSN